MRYFLGLGTWGFGGPIASVGYMQRDLVERRGWLDKQDFLNGVALGQTMPGPLAAQVVMWVGFLRRGRVGALATAAAFIAPSFGLVLVVAAVYVRYSGHGQIVAGPPKTPHSMRVITLDRSTIAALRAHQERQRAEQALYGDGYRESGYVFTNRNGDPVAPGHLTHSFQRLIRENDVPPIRLHDLRHGAATLALAAGVELKVVQEMLGHCSIVLTADTYTSVKSPAPPISAAAGRRPPRKRQPPM